MKTTSIAGLVIASLLGIAIVVITAPGCTPTGAATVRAGQMVHECKDLRYFWWSR